MTQNHEKRKSLRRGGSPFLTYQLSLFGKKHSASGLNHSDSGMSFENGSEIMPGTIVYLKRDRCAPDCTPGEVCNGCRSTTLATVKWCQKIQSRETESYRIGANYFQF